MALSVKPNFFPELWMTTGWRGMALKREESLLGDESLEDGSEEREYGDRGLARGDTPKISGRRRNNHQLSRSYDGFHPSLPPMTTALRAELPENSKPKVGKLFDLWSTKKF